MGSIVSQPTSQPVSRLAVQLGSLGDDAAPGTTLSDPTIADPTSVWQDNVLAQLAAGVKTLQMAEMQKWLQIAATLSIPLAAAVWKMIFKRGADIT
jgi:hypothetical protein